MLRGARPRSATGAGDRVRVLMLSWRGPDHPRAGGAERYTAEVLQRLAQRGHAVTWFCEGPATPLPGVRVLAGGAFPALLAAGRRHLRRHRRELDLVVDQINGAGFLTPIASPLPHLAFIHQRAADLWAHERSGWRRRFGPPLEAGLLAVYRRSPFLTVSRTTLLDLRAQRWTGPGYVAPNGVEPPPGPPPRKEPVPTLVFLARLGVPGKRLGDALAAYARIRQTMPAAQLWVVGRGGPPTQAQSGVRFFVNADDELRDDLLARAWLLIATSVREGWGRMVLEAAICGTACAVYGTPGLAEAAEAVGGVVTAPDPESLAAAALALLRAPAVCARAGARARGLAAAFGWERTCAIWESALQATVAGDHGQGVTSGGSAVWLGRRRG